MIAEYLKIGLDVVILAGLIGFIFYALKLSKALNAFRSHRNQFDGTMAQLSKNIEDAQSSLANLKDTSQETSEHLSKLVDEGQELCDELQLINEASNSLATRLETLARQSRKIPEATAERTNVRRANDDFMIQDQEYEDESSDEEFDDDPDMDNLSSAAEKELFRALKKNQN